jgi:hypothetical protein
MPFLKKSLAGFSPSITITMLYIAVDYNNHIWLAAFGVGRGVVILSRC